MARRPRIALLAASAAALAAAALWVLTFHTEAGRWLNAVTLDGFNLLLGWRPGQSGALADELARLADPVPFAFCALVMIAIALARGRVRVALAVPAILLGANATTQALKAWLPAVQIDERVAAGSYPSGHATAAMSLALCLVLVVPGRLRLLAALAGSLYAVVVSFAILGVDWHLPSDVLGAFAVAAAWTAVGAAALLGAGRRWPERSGREALSRVGGRASASLSPAVILCALIAASAIGLGVALARGPGLVDFAQQNTSFVTVAGLIGALSLGLAMGLAALLRR